MSPLARNVSLALLLACAPLRLARAQDPGGGILWQDVELPRGFALELESALVTNRPAAGVAVLRYESGRLIGSGLALRALPRTEDGRPQARIARGEGEPVAEQAALAGSELAFDLEGFPSDLEALSSDPDAVASHLTRRGWGYLRVLAVRPERLSLELAFDRRPEGVELERVPAAVQATSLAEGVELDWEGATLEADAYRVERRPLAEGRADPSGPWALVGEVREPRVRDEGAEPGVIYEYRVTHTGTGHGFGCRERGTAALLPEDRPIAIARGQPVDLLTGRMDTGRVDLRVEFVGNNGAQFGCGEGVTLRLLGLPERTGWELPPAVAELYRDQRTFVNADRELAIHLPEGIYVRVRVETAQGAEALLYRQLDLRGGRVFPPAPPAPAAEWRAGEVVALELGTTPEGEQPAELEREVEREERYLGGAWKRVGHWPQDSPQWIDATAERRGLLRYRLRYVLGGGRRSPPGPPALVLLGDDRGPEAERMLEEALVELAAPEFERRQEAQGVLVALGARAWPALRELLGSDDPERVAVARDILSRAPAGAATSEAPDAESPGELAPILLRARAEAGGLGPPPAGWLAESPGQRALELLCSGRELVHEPWRRLLAEADPDPGVRLVASVLGSWGSARAPGTPAFAPPEDPSLPLRRFDLSAFALELFDEEAAARDVLARLDPSRPWTALVRLMVLHDLARAGRRGAEDRGALERAALAESLLARHEADPDEQVFFPAALGLIEDPAARLLAASNLADLRLGRQAGPPGGADGLERSVLRLAAPDSRLLADELETLRLGEAQDVDVVLPPGVYEPLERMPAMALGGRGVRLLGEGRVVLRTSLTIQRGADVVLEGLVLAPETGSALILDRCAVLVRDCLIEAPALAAQASDGVLELERTQIVRRVADDRLSGGVRLGKDSLLLARESRILAGGGAVFGARFTFLERCAIDGGTRTGVEGRPDGDVLLIDCYVRGDQAALANVYRGALEGVILVSEGEAAQGLRPGCVLCAVHAVHAGAPGALELAERSAGCPLGR